MTGPKGNSAFCFPETSMSPEVKPKGTLRFEGKQNSLFPEGPAIKRFVKPPDSKLEKNCEKLIYCDCACSTSGSQTELSYRNETITVFFFGANKEKRQY